MRKRMMAAVPEASVVITNPTHFAVALKYERGMNAPICVAKGIDAIALKIREVAEEHGVPVVENPPLARALHGTVEIDQEIPPEHYQAVAEVIGYVMRLNRRRPARAEPTVVEGISASIDAREGRQVRPSRRARNRIDRNDHDAAAGTWRYRAGVGRPHPHRAAAAAASASSS